MVQFKQVSDLLNLVATDAQSDLRKSNEIAPVISLTQQSLSKEAVLNEEKHLFRHLLSGHQVLVPGSQGPEVRALQGLLNEWRSTNGLAPLPVNGLYDQATREALKSFQLVTAINTDGSITSPKTDQDGRRISGLEVDGISGVRTLYALMVSQGRAPYQSFGKFVEISGGVYDISHVRHSYLATDLEIPNDVRRSLYEHVRNAGLSERFLAENERIAQKHGVTGEQLLVIYWGENRFRTGRHFPNDPNRTDTGLIGFTKEPAKEIGTTVEALARMSAEQQLVYVDKYLTMWEKRLGTRFDSFADLYLAIHRPSKVTAPDDAIVRVAGRRMRKDNVDNLMFKRV